MRIRDWSSDVCSSDLLFLRGERVGWRRSALRRRGNKISEFGPLAAHGAVRLRLRGPIVIVHCRQVLKVEDVSEGRLVDPKVENPHVEPSLRGLDDRQSVV